PPQRNHGSSKTSAQELPGCTKTSTKMGGSSFFPAYSTSGSAALRGPRGGGPTATTQSQSSTNSNTTSCTRTTRILRPRDEHDRSTQHQTGQEQQERQVDAEAAHLQKMLEQGSANKTRKNSTVAQQLVSAVLLLLQKPELNTTSGNKTGASELG
ncbi:unnamed protein product, partial [Amoebophrya sp. A25]